MSGACGAAACRVDWGVVALKAGVKEVQLAAVCEYVCVAAVACGQYAVEEVDASVHRFEKVFGRADAHQVAGFILWQIGYDILKDLVHLRMSFAHRKPADCITRQVELADYLCMLDADIAVQAALVYPKHKLVAVNGVFIVVELLELVHAAAQPAGCPCDGILDVAAFGGDCDTFVERHGDCRGEVRLYLHAFLGADKYAPSINMRGELHARFGYLALMRQ